MNNRIRQIQKLKKKKRSKEITTSFLKFFSCFVPYFFGPLSLIYLVLLLSTFLANQSSLCVCECARTRASRNWLSLFQKTHHKNSSDGFRYLPHGSLALSCSSSSVSFACPPTSLLLRHRVSKWLTSSVFKPTPLVRRSPSSDDHFQTSKSPFVGRTPCFISKAKMLVFLAKCHWCGAQRSPLFR